MSVSDDPRLGTVLAGYRIEGLLGRRGMGVVYQAEDLRLKRRVALKLLSPELAADKAFLARFLTESELAAWIDDPNIVPIYEAGESNELLRIAMATWRGATCRSPSRRPLATVPPYGVDQLENVDGFRDVAVEAGGQEPVAVAVHRLGCEREHRHRRGALVRPQPPERFDAVDVRQLDVHQHEVRPVLDGQLERLLAGGRPQRPVPRRRQHVAEQLHARLVVLDD